MPLPAVRVMCDVCCVMCVECRVIMCNKYLLLCVQLNASAAAANTFSNTTHKLLLSERVLSSHHYHDHVAEASIVADIMNVG